MGSYIPSKSEVRFHQTQKNSQKQQLIVSQNQMVTKTISSIPNLDYLTNDGRYTYYCQRLCIRHSCIAKCLISALGPYQIFQFLKCKKPIRRKGLIEGLLNFLLTKMYKSIAKSTVDIPKIHRIYLISQSYEESNLELHLFQENIEKVNECSFMLLLCYTLKFVLVWRRRLRKAVQLFTCSYFAGCTLLKIHLILIELFT